MCSVKCDVCSVLCSVPCLACLLQVWLGLPSHLHPEYPPHCLAKILTDFGLQFKLEWERVASGAGSGGRKEEPGGRSKRRSAPDLGRLEGGGELEECLVDMMARRERHSSVQATEKA